MQKQKHVARNKWLDILIFVLFLNVFFFHNFGVVALALFMAGWYLLASSIFGRFEHWLNVLFGTSMVTMFFVNNPEKIGLLVGLSILIIMTGVYRGLKSGSINGLLELGLSPFLVGFEYVRSGFTLMASALRGTL